MSEPKKSELLYKLMIHKGYPEEFSRFVNKHITEHANQSINDLYRNINE